MVTLRELMKEGSAKPTHRTAKIYRNNEQPPDDRGYMPGTMADRLSYMWQVTQDAWAFAPGAHHEDQSKQEFQRHVTVLIRAPVPDCIHTS